MTTKTFYVTTISGGTVVGVPDLTDADFTIEAVIGDTDISSTSTVSEELSGTYVGYYTVDVGDLSIGDGRVSLTPDLSAYSVTPTFYELSRESVSTLDDIYGVISSSIAAPVTVDTASRYGQVTIRMKASDDFDEDLNVPSRYRPLTAWTNWSTKVYPADRLTDGSVAALGSGTVTVIDATNGIVNVNFSNTLFPDTLIPTSYTSTTLVADVQGQDGDGNVRTVIEIFIKLRRDCNA